MAVVLFFCAALHRAAFRRFFAADSEGLGAVLKIIGTLYSALYAGAAYVIWEQFAAVENTIPRNQGR